MTNADKNEYLVKEVLKECWHEVNLLDLSVKSIKRDIVCTCGWSGTEWELESHLPVKLNHSFYTTDPDQQAINFFRLWNVIKKEKDWFNDFINWCSKWDCDGSNFSFDLDYIVCSVLADAIGEYWKWGKIE